jgi:hypothetical protein
VDISSEHNKRLSRSDFFHKVCDLDGSSRFAQK